MKSFIRTIIGILLTSFPYKTLAYNNWGPDVNLFSIYDVFFDILSFSIAVVALGIGFQMLNRLIGNLRSAWRFYIMAMGFFVVMQILALLSVFDIFSLSGFFAIIKFFMAIAFLVTVLNLRHFIQKILRDKSVKEKDTGNLE